MKTIYTAIALSLLSLSFFSCERPPELPYEPKISFSKVALKTDDASGQDLLSITIFFEDGDGDLGLTSEKAKRPPFHENTYFLATPPYHPITDISGIPSDSLLRYGDLDSLPPFSCLNYTLMSGKTGEDTVYIQPNPKGKNFIVKFFLKKEGTFEEFNFLKETCIPSGGTFTQLNTADHDRPLRGNLTYTFRALSFYQFFDNYPIKLQIQIMDRAQHMSNVVESPEFILDDILE